MGKAIEFFGWVKIAWEIKLDIEKESDLSRYSRAGFKLIIFSF
jgi:hypothetical protein